jgi:BclB C-terminal domain-containing protein
LPGLIGFGNSIQAPTVLGGTIDTTALTNFAFSLPRDGTITALAAYLSATAAVTLLAPLTYTVEIYSSTTPDNVFSPTGTSVDIVIPATINIGDTYNGISTGLALAVTQETRLLLVASATGGGFLATGSVIGYVSAGLSIT